MTNLCFMLASLFLIGGWDANNCFIALHIAAPTSLTYKWEKNKDALKPCSLKLSTTNVPGAIFYDWEVEATNGSVSKTTSKPSLSNISVVAEYLTVRVRVRDASHTSDYYVERLEIHTPSDCCLH